MLPIESSAMHRCGKSDEVMAAPGRSRRSPADGERLLQTMGSQSAFIVERQLMCKADVDASPLWKTGPLKEADIPLCRPVERLLAKAANRRCRPWAAHPAGGLISSKPTMGWRQAASPHSLYLRKFACEALVVRGPPFHLEL